MLIAIAHAEIKYTPEQQALYLSAEIDGNCAHEFCDSVTALLECRTVDDCCEQYMHRKATVDMCLGCSFQAQNNLLVVDFLRSRYFNNLQVLVEFTNLLVMFESCD